MRAIEVRAGTAFPTISELTAKNSKLQAMFSDAASKVARSELLDHLDPESIVRIHSASDEGAACIQTQPTAPNRCFTSLEFRIFIYLRLGIQISKEDIDILQGGCQLPSMFKPQWPLKSAPGKWMQTRGLYTQEA
jgi:hypothetical protein